MEDERDDATKELTTGDETENLVKRLRKKFDQPLSRNLNPDIDTACTDGGRDTGTAGQGDAGVPPELTSDGSVASSVDNSDNGLYLKKIKSTNVSTCSAVGGEAGGQLVGLPMVERFVFGD